MTGTNLTSGAAAAAPMLPAASAPAAATALRDLRRWHLGSGPGLPLPADALPALLAAFRDPARVRHDYPLVVEHTAETLRARPLGEVLPELVQHATAQAKVLQDNLQRLERRVRLLLTQHAGDDAKALLRTAGEQMLAEMQLRENIASGVKQDLDAMWQALPAAELLPLQPDTSLRLLFAAAQQRATVARQQFVARAKANAEGLRALLQVEEQKDPEARSPAALQQSLGGSTQFFDPAALARTVGQHRGSQRVDPERRRRLEFALEALEEHLDAPALPTLVVLHSGKAPTLVGATLLESADVCAAAVQQFDLFAAQLLAAVRAMQISALEQRGAYEPARHDPMLAALSWQDLSADELQLLPVVVAMAPEQDLAGAELGALMQLLASGRPVQVLALRAPAQDPLQGHGALSHTRLELGYLGIANRSAYVQQSTAARPTHLLAGFQKALGGSCPGLHVVDPGLDEAGLEPPLGAFLHASAATEGRAQPLFQYDPEAGCTWARRFDFAHNPSPDDDWPQNSLPVRTAVGASEVLRLGFTFADYALLEGSLRQGFALVPDAMQSEDLVPLTDYLQLQGDAANHAIPFVWVASGSSKPLLHRAAVSRALVAACRDRLRFWRTLQELAGVRNEHVREAVQRAREEAAADAAREREALQQQHQQDLEQARAETAGVAMEGLARMLLELDPLGAAPASIPRATPGAAASAPVAATEAPPAAVEAAPATAAPAEDDGFDEAWIESVRCSTCNDCVNMNPLMFVYNENKQARIADAKAGTYAQLVQAAEKCPSRCIHPGKPQNPGEPNLEALVARASPFNR